MTLFFSALAGSVLLGVLLWKLGQREPRPTREDGLGSVIAWLILCALPILQAVHEWADLGSAMRHIHAASAADLPGYLADAQRARGGLVIRVAWASVVFTLFVAHLSRLIKAFMRRRSDAKAKLQETHA